MRRQPAQCKARVIHTPKRVLVATATMVAMIATVGAPFKWSMMWHPVRLTPNVDALR